MRLSRLLLGLSLLAALTGCRKDDGTGSTAGTMLYLYDNSSHQVLVWKDMEALYDAAAVPAPDLTLSASLFATKADNLSWGGMAIDTQRNQLFLVSDTGSVVRVNNLRLQTGVISTAGDIASFSLSNPTPLTNSRFGQASLDPSTGTLYIAENGDNATRIWVIPNAGSIPDTSTAPATTFLPAASNGDGGGRSVAADAGKIYAYMKSGNTVTDGGGFKYDGARLRRSSDGVGFDQVIIDATGASPSVTELADYGSLALDSANSTLYVGVATGAASVTTPPVLAFRTGVFAQGFSQAPSFPLGDASLVDLRVLSHARIKDWLVGLRGLQGATPSADTAYPDLLVWKAPSSNNAVVTRKISLGSTYAFRGAALDGSGG